MWEEPSITEINMNAEIGAYQEDDAGDRPWEPVVSDDAEG